jgi:hypothetical protein
LREAGNTSDPLYQNWVMGNRDFVANKKRFEKEKERFRKTKALPKNKLISKFLDLTLSNDELLKEIKSLRDMIKDQSRLEDVINKIHDLAEDF